MSKNKTRNLPYPRAHAVTVWSPGGQPFSRSLGYDLSEGTYGTVTVEFVERGTLYVETDNHEEATWWLALLRGYAEVVSVFFSPAVDQYETNLPFSPPENEDGTVLTIQDVIIR